MAYNSAYTGPQVDAAVGAVQGKETTWDGKQDKLTGQSGQVVGFDAEGNAIAQTPPETGDVKADGSVPMTGDLNMGGHRITNVSAPTQPTDAVRQSDLKTVSDEVDGIISGATPIILPPATITKIGGVKIGDGVEVAEDGTISVTPGLTQSEADERYLQLNSDAMITGDVTFKYGADFDGSKITSVGTPVNGSDGANKAYVDSKAPLPPVPVTLTTSGWSSNTQTVTVSGVSASETAQLITPTPAILSQSAYYEAGIMCTNQAENSLTFTCQTVPTSNLTVYVVIQPLN
jgi:hypothetical protein|nr:MAG TPA: tail fiber-like protein [Caudoviricetes sp.]